MGCRPRRDRRAARGERPSHARVAVALLAHKQGVVATHAQQAARAANTLSPPLSSALIIATPQTVPAAQPLLRSTAASS